MTSTKVTKVGVYLRSVAGYQSSQHKMIFIFILASLVAVAQSAILKNGEVVPTYANVCKRSQPDVDKCLKTSIQKLIKTISKNGIPEVGLFPLDPLKVPRVNATYGLVGLFQITILINDSNVYDVSKFFIRRVKSNFNDPKNIIMEVDIFTKSLSNVGKYSVKGTVTLMNVNDKGTSIANLTDVKGTMKIKGHLVEKDGDEFLQIDHSLWRPDISDLKLNLSTENAESPTLVKLVMTLTNQFWKFLWYRVLINFAEVELDEIFTEMFNNVTLKIPFNQLIPQ